MDRATVQVYDERATEWRRRRGPGPLDTLDDLLGRDAVGPQADLGCGPGPHLDHFTQPVLALDASEQMVRLARAAAPEALGVVGDLEHLPVRPGALGAAWAAKSYHHVPSGRLALALADLHRAMRVGGVVGLRVQHGATEGVVGGDFPGRYFAASSLEGFVDLVTGAGFDIARAFVRPDDEWIDCIATRAWSLPDYVGAGMRILLVGLNPSPYASDTGVGFARPGNRFWPAALGSGLVAHDRDPRDALVSHGVGMTDLVKRTTRRASELRAEEYRDGMARLERLVRRWTPGVVAFVGLSGYRAAVDSAAQPGWQTDGIGGSGVYVMPNPSGANAHVTLDELVGHLREIADR